MLATVTLDPNVWQRLHRELPSGLSLPEVEVDVDFDYGFPPSVWTAELGEDPSIEVLNIRFVWHSTLKPGDSPDWTSFSWGLEVPEAIILHLSEIIKDLRGGWYDEQLIDLAEKELAPDHEEKS